MGCSHQEPKPVVTSAATTVVPPKPVPPPPPPATPEARKSFIHGIVSGQQEQHRKRRILRKKNHNQLLSQGDYNSYISDVVKDLKENQIIVKELTGKIQEQLGLSSPVALGKEAVDDVSSYLKLRGVSKEEVRVWLGEKIKIIKRDGKGLGERLAQTTLGVEDRKLSTDILQVMIEDKLQTDRGYLLSVAYEFLYEKELPEAVQWMNSVALISKELGFKGK